MKIIFIVFLVCALIIILTLITKEKLKEQINAEQNILEIMKDDECKLQDTIKENFERIQSTQDEYWDKLQVYNSLIEIVDDETAATKEEIEKFQRMRAAFIKIQLEEKESEDKQIFHQIEISDFDKQDIETIEKMKPMLKNPRILSMLVWQSFIQKPYKVLCSNVLGTEKICGIYKITSTSSSMVYIGQAKDVAKRWGEHLKAGCGVDTPPGNKLYKAMQDEGVWNFTFELLEECPSNELDEKERTYIEIYDSYNYGFNSTKGNK